MQFLAKCRGRQSVQLINSSSRDKKVRGQSARCSRFHSFLAAIETPKQSGRKARWEGLDPVVPISGLTRCSGLLNVVCFSRVVSGQLGTLRSLLLRHCGLDPLVLWQLVRRLAEAFRVHRLHGHGLPEVWNGASSLPAYAGQRGFTSSGFECFHFKGTVCLLSFGQSFRQDPSGSLHCQTRSVLGQSHDDMPMVVPTRAWLDEVRRFMRRDCYTGRNPDRTDTELVLQRSQSVSVRAKGSYLAIRAEAQERSRTS